MFTTSQTPWLLLPSPPFTETNVHLLNNSEISSIMLLSKGHLECSNCTISEHYVLYFVSKIRLPWLEKNTFFNVQFAFCEWCLRKNKLSETVTVIITVACLISLSTLISEEAGRPIPNTEALTKK